MPTLSQGSVAVDYRAVEQDPEEPEGTNDGNRGPKVVNAASNNATPISGTITGTITGTVSGTGAGTSAGAALVRHRVIRQRPSTLQPGQKTPPPPPRTTDGNRDGGSHESQVLPQ